MRKDRRALGASADLPDLWSDALLRQLAEPSRDQACAHQRTSGDRVCTTGRALVVLLSGRDALRILIAASARVGCLFSLGFLDKFSNLWRGHRSCLARHFETVLKQRHRRDRSNPKAEPETWHFFCIHLCNE